jgi:predicted DsbA family dithiol-disulfide isomerase
MIDVASGTVVVYSDLTCPWAHLAVHRLLTTRHDLGLDNEVVLDHRAFVLEVANRRPTPRRVLDAEIPVVGGLEPAAGWQIWQDDASRWPVTALPALEAVQAAKEQGLRQSERLDRGLRAALFARSKCISMRHVILDVADGCGLDVDRLAGALDDGRARRAVMEQHAAAVAGGAAGEGPVQGSPHLFLPDGTDCHNPGIEMHWHGEHGRGFPVVTADDRTIYGDLLVRAARLAA